MKKHIISGLLVLSVLVPASSFAQYFNADIDPNPNTSSCVSINNNLRYQSRDVNTNGEVSTLQDFLQSKGYLNSEPTGYFGLMTLAAVKKFQISNGIEGTGYVGPLTRAKIKTLTCGGITTPQPTPTPRPNPCPKGAVFSSENGKPCNPNLPPGCWSTSGFSSVTGMPCGQTNYPEPWVEVKSNNGEKIANINKGEFAYIHWTSLNTYSCTAVGSSWDSVRDQLSDELTTTGYISVRPEKSAEYTISCKGLTKTVSDSMKVNVNVSSSSTLTIIAPKNNGSYSTQLDKLRWRNSDTSNSNDRYEVVLKAVSVKPYITGTTLAAVTLSSAGAECSASNECSYFLNTLYDKIFNPGTYKVSVKNLQSNASDSITYTITPISTCSDFGFDARTGLPCGCTTNSGWSTTTGVSCGGNTPPSITLKANGLGNDAGMININSGDPVILSWKGAGVGSCRLYDQVSQIGLTTNYNISPISDSYRPASLSTSHAYTFTIKCGPNVTMDTVSDSVMVWIHPPASTCSDSGYDTRTGLLCGCSTNSGWSTTTGLPCGEVPFPSVNVYMMSPATQSASGWTADISWSSTNAERCEAHNGWTTLKNTHGTARVSNIQETTTFQMVCYNSINQNASDSLIIYAGNYPAGCSSNEGWSTTTGESCGSVLGAYINLKPGCTSLLGFSATTGQSCKQ